MKLKHFGDPEEKESPKQPDTKYTKRSRYEIVGKFSTDGTVYRPGDEMPSISDKTLQFLLRKRVVRSLEE